MAKIKAKEHENLSESNIKKVIELLEAEKPISKKDACEILNISYNTARLAKIIENYKSELEEQSKRRAANRGKPASPFEIQSVIESFLDGVAIADIAKRIYRPTTFVKDVVDKVGVPHRPTGEGRARPGLIPDPCASDTFEPGQVVWSAKYHCMVIVLREADNWQSWGSSQNNSSPYYEIYVIEPIEEVSPYFPQYQEYGGRYSGSRAYDLGSLEHLKQYGVDVYRPYRPHFKKWLSGR